MDPVGATWMIPPMVKMAEARTRERRRPKRAVNGQTKKQEKKAGR